MKYQGIKEAMMSDLNKSAFDGFKKNIKETEERLKRKEEVSREATTRDFHKYQERMMIEEQGLNPNNSKHVSFYEQRSQMSRTAPTGWNERKSVVSKSVFPMPSKREEYLEIDNKMK